MKSFQMKAGLFSLVISSGLVFTACEKKEEAPTVPGIDIAKMDQNISPKDDFFKYVNGTWYDNTEIPSDRTRWGSFDELRQMTDEDALAILQEAMESEALKDAPAPGNITEQQTLKVLSH